MKEYIGTKFVKAKPMTRGEYNKKRMWKTPENENENDQGYLVEYPDSKRNVKGEHEGYVSWSPADIFERSYREADGLNFGLAIEALKKGNKVARKGWNGGGMWLVYVEGRKAELEIKTPYYKAINSKKEIKTTIEINSHIDIYTSQGDMQPGWLASQADMLADDWYIVE